RRRRAGFHGDEGDDPAAVRLQGEHGATDLACRFRAVADGVSTAGAGGDGGADLAGGGEHAGVWGRLFAPDGAWRMMGVRRVLRPAADVAIPAPEPSPVPDPISEPSVAPSAPGPIPPPTHATRGQRIALLVGLVVVFLLALQLFASILLPFVMAALIAYGLDPVAVRLVRLGMPRGGAALLLIVAAIAAVFLFALLLYPLILNQIGLLIGRIPQYATQFQAWANQLIKHLQEQLGSDYVDNNLRDVVGGQMGAMLSFLATALSRVIG